MSRILTLAYGVVSYLIFFLTFLYAIGFLGNVVVPKSLDSGPTDPWLTALTIDLALLSVFAIQHSVMARQGFKRFVNRLIPEGTERSTYVLASSLALILLFWQWRPLGGVIWDVQHPAGRALLYGGFAFGWLLVLGATAVINHFDLFGLRQSWRAFRGRPAGSTPVRDAGFLSPGSSPALRRLALHLLEHTHDDRDALAVCVRDYGLHPGRNPARGTRSYERSSGIRGVPPTSADADAGVALERRTNRGRSRRSRVRQGK